MCVADSTSGVGSTITSDDDEEKRMESLIQKSVKSNFKDMMDVVIETRKSVDVVGLDLENQIKQHEWNSKAELKSVLKDVMKEFVEKFEHEHLTNERNVRLLVDKFEARRTDFENDVDTILKQKYEDFKILLDSRSDALTANVNTMSSKLNDVGKSLKSIMTCIDTLSSGIDNIQGRTDIIMELYNTIGAVETKIDDVLKTVSAPPV